MLRVHLFGTLTLFDDDRALTPPPSTDARALLAFLVLRRAPGGHPRAALLGHFWPDDPEDRARRALRQSLWHIRRCAPLLIASDSETVQRDPQTEVWVDALEFQRLAAANALAPLRRAVELYRGDLLEGYYADWILAERERLREARDSALERLCALEKAAGQFAPALEHALALLHADPLRESAHREAMRLHALLGRPDAALKQFEACRQILRVELGVEPEAETDALAREIARRAPIAEAISSTEMRETPLVGRSAERAQLLAHIESALAGLGGIALIEGEAGVGKTRLLQDMARDAEWRGAQTVWAAHSEASADPLLTALASGLTPLRAAQLAHTLERVWLQVLAPALPPLAEAAPGLSPLPALDPGPESQRWQEAVRQLLTHWATITPLLMVLDDAQRATADTFDLLFALLPALRSMRVLVCLVTQSEEARAQPGVWEKLQSLDRAGLLGRLSLARLDASATAQLIRHSLGLAQAAPLFEQRVFGETAGNPLFVLETLRVLREENLLTPEEGGGWRTPFDEATANYAELPLPPAVERVIARRLHHLPPPLRRVLNAAAVLGEAFEFATLRAVCAADTDAPALLNLIGELVRRHFLVETARALAFGHGKLQQAAYAALAPDERQTLHRLAARALTDAPAEILARHCTAGALWPEAVTHHLRAAERANIAYAHRAAFHHYSIALDILNQHAPFDEPRNAVLRCDALLERAAVAGVLGDKAQQGADTEAAQTLAQTLADPARPARALIRRAYFLGEAQDQYAAAQELAHAALTVAQAHGLLEEEARATEILALTCQWNEAKPQAEAHFRRALELWETLRPASAEVANIHYRLAQIYRRGSQLEQCEAEAQAASRLAQAIHDPLTTLRAEEVLGSLAMRRGDYPASIRHNRAAAEQAGAIGFRRLQSTSLNNLGTNHWYLREYGAALTHLRHALEIGRTVGDKRNIISPLFVLGYIYFETGNNAEAEAMFTEALMLTREIHYLLREAAVLYGLGALRLRQGRVAEARACFQQELEIARNAHILTEEGNALFGLGLAEREGGALSEALSYFEQAAQLFAANEVIDMVPVSRSSAAECLLALGRAEEAARLSAQAVQDLLATSETNEGPTVYYHHWRILRAAGQTAEARAALEKAHGLIRRQQATLPEGEAQSRFIEVPPVHRAIVAEINALREAEQITVRLPLASAPTGRPLRETEWATVRWTLDAPEDAALPDKAARRQHRLQRLLTEAAEQNAAPTVDDLAEALAVNPKTIKRDLAALRATGVAVSTRGARS